MPSFDGKAIQGRIGTRTYSKETKVCLPPLIRNKFSLSTSSALVGLTEHTVNILKCNFFVYQPLQESMLAQVPIGTSAILRGLTEWAADIHQRAIPLYQPLLIYNAIQRPGLPGVVLGGSSKQKKYRRFPNPHIPLTKGVK